MHNEASFRHRQPNIYKGCVIVEGHIESAAVYSEHNWLITRVRHNCACCQLGRPTALQWTLVVTGQHIDILMHACTHTCRHQHTPTHKNVYSHKTTHTLKHMYTEATGYTLCLIMQQQTSSAQLSGK